MNLDKWGVQVLHPLDSTLTNLERFWLNSNILERYTKRNINFKSCDKAVDSIVLELDEQLKERKEVDGDGYVCGTRVCVGLVREGRSIKAHIWDSHYFIVT